MIPHRVLTYYGDDFTGSTDVMEVLTWAGLPTVLFLEPPDDRLLQRFPEARAIGIAGISRSRDPVWMDRHLPRILGRLKELEAPLCHYKVCSTFDSSPSTGSIGRALEIGQDIFETPWVPILVGAPPLKRHQVFGNLFASVKGETFRLDRHPTMSCHPVTPMGEADLCRHLAHQTERPIGLLDILALHSPNPEGHLGAVLKQDPSGVLFDVLDEDSLATAGRFLWTRRPNAQTFCVGSSGIEYALVAHWRAAGNLAREFVAEGARETDRIVVVSGSCSPETETSIRWALDHGYTGVRLDVPGMAARSPDAYRAAIDAAMEALRRSKSVILYTALGPQDSHLASADGDFHQNLGVGIGSVLRKVLELSGVGRAVVCGGDTSSYAGQQLGIYALTALTPISPGAPLCRCAAEGPLDGLEIVFKGGQRGGLGFFEQVRMATGDAATGGS